MYVITWNMQGATGTKESKWNTNITQLFNAGISVACLQECGDLPPTAQIVAAPPWLNVIPPVGLQGCYCSWQLGSLSRGKTLYIVWLQTDPNGNRVNLAVVSEYPPSHLIYIPPGLLGARPALGIRLLYGPNLQIFTLHALSGSGVDAPNLITNIVNDFQVANGPWFAAGDYNREPITWAVPQPAVYCEHNPSYTFPRSKSNFDYAVKNPGLTHFMGKVWDKFVVSDHYPVSYEIS